MGDDASFYIDYSKYYFVVFSRPIEDLEEIYALQENLAGYHRIIKNRFDSIATPYKGKNYCLLKVYGPEHSEIDITDMLANIIPVKITASSLLRTDWGSLWSSKVDYLEYQISELGMTHKAARHSFSYYVGLAENAIEYFNLLKPEDLEVVIGHRRLKNSFVSKDYYDPLNVVIDYRPRDFAAYFKTKFFEGEEVLREVKILVDRNIFSPLEYNLLFCRLLYPSYYFDALGKVLELGYDDDTLLQYIEKVDAYEDFLRSTYELLKTKSSMLKIDWLLERS